MIVVNNVKMKQYVLVCSTPSNPDITFSEFPFFMGICKGRVLQTSTAHDPQGAKETHNSSQPRGLGRTRITGLGVCQVSTHIKQTDTNFEDTIEVLFKINLP